MNEEDLEKFTKDVMQIYREKKILKCTHFCGGNEKQVMNVFKKIKKDDWLFIPHRNHYQLLLREISKDTILEHIHATGQCFFSRKDKIFSSAILGSILPIAVGVAMMIKRENSKEHVWTFCGDMTAEMGIFHECSKYASRHNLPITFVVEDNGYGIVNTTEVWGNKKSNNVIRYKYDKCTPHIGIGEWIDYDNVS